MSYDLKAATSRLVFDGILVPTASFTLCCWVKRDVDRGTNSVVVSIDDGSNNNLFLIGTDTSGDLLFIEQLTSGVVDIDVSGPTLNNTDWFFVCISRNGTGLNGAKFYYRTNHGLMQTAQVTMATSFTATRLTIGDLATTGEFFNGKIANVKFWSQALTLGEVQAEADFVEVQRTSAIQGHWLKPNNSEYRRDFSLGGRTLVGTGGIIGIIDPPITPRIHRKNWTKAVAAATSTWPGYCSDINNGWF